MASKVYNVFISHSWNYDNHYNKLVEFLDNHPDFDYKNYSIDKDSAIEGSNKKVWEEIESSIKMSSGIVIPAGLYSSYSDSIAKEIKIAQNYDKKIIGVIPYGQEKTSKTVTDNAHETVGWSSSSVVKAIKTHF